MNTTGQSSSMTEKNITLMSLLLKQRDLTKAFLFELSSIIQEKDNLELARRDIEKIPSRTTRLAKNRDLLHHLNQLDKHEDRLTELHEEDMKSLDKQIRQLEDQESQQKAPVRYFIQL